MNINNLSLLLKTEYKKFRPNATVSLLAIVFTILLPVAILTIKGLFRNNNFGPIKSANDIYSFPMIWDYQGYVGSWMVFFFLGFMVIHMYTSEVSYRTMRQNIITGYTRKEYYWSKLSTIISLSLLATVIYILSSVVIGAFHTEGFDLDLMIDTNWAPLRFFIMSMGYLSLAFFISTLLKKGGLSIIFYFIYFMIVEPILKALYLYLLVKRYVGPNGIENPDNLDIAELLSQQDYSGFMGKLNYLLDHTILHPHSFNYLPTNVFEDNFAFPLMRTGSDFFQHESGFQVVLPLMTSGIVSILYISGFLYLAYRNIMKSDV